MEEEHLQWVLEGTRFSPKVISLFRDHYVNGISRSVCSGLHGMTRPFASKKFSRFDELLTKKCEAEGIRITTILHVKDAMEKVNALDVIKSRQKNQKGKT